MKFYTGRAVDARRYVEADAFGADDYYLREGAGVAERFLVAGPAVERAPAMDAETYERWVGGCDVETGMPKGRLRKDANAVKFVEVTVNGPKSWSLAAAAHSEIAAAYDAAQWRAVEQILAWVGEYATTRVGPRGRQVQVPVERLEAAVVAHRTSRSGDPHWHLHLQISSRVWAVETWRGLHTVGTRDSIAAINGIGHAAVMTDPGFRAALAAHGYHVDDASGEIIELVPYVEAFSARSKQIAENIDSYESAWRREHPGEEPGPRLRQAWDRRAWADERPDKVVPTSGAALEAHWRQELGALGFRPSQLPVRLRSPKPGRFDRSQMTAEALCRLGARRSAWSHADARGAADVLIAETGLIADAGVRLEVAEDLTARIIAASVPLVDRADLPVDVRALSSLRVVAVERYLAAGFSDRGKSRGRPDERVRASAWAAGLDDDQATAVAHLAGTERLVVVEGAAGAGKTRTLAAAQHALLRRRKGMVVVAPTLKGAKVAADEVGAPASSVAWLLSQYGFEWDDQGHWAYTASAPSASASLGRGDLLVVDEAGMLDQDSAVAVLQIVEMTGARLALVGDRHQLPAVGRGGVLDLACRYAAQCHVDLDGVRRFADPDYAALTLRMRTGERPEEVFDDLLARGEIVLHGSEVEQTAALADLATTSTADTAVVADTRDQVARINGLARRGTAARRPSEVWMTRAGERIGVGDRVATRRNDPDRDVANRETWSVIAADRSGLTVEGDGGRRHLAAEYVREHVELAYATTAYGVQGATVATAHVAVGAHSSASSAYVGMTRGRERNVAHLVAEDVDDARRQWAAVFGRDRADLGPARAAQRAVDDIEQYGLRSMPRYVRTVREPSGGTRNSRGPRPMPPELQRPTRTGAPGIGL